jgi:hypothetical protein
MQVNDVLKHYKTLPRRSLQAELRRFTGDRQLYLWEFVGMNWFYTPVRAGRQTALQFGVPEGSIVGYHVPEDGGHKMGSAIGDLENVMRQDAPYPDAFANSA